MDLEEVDPTLWLLLDLALAGAVFHNHVSSTAAASMVTRFCIIMPAESVLQRLCDYHVELQRE